MFRTEPVLGANKLNTAQSLNARCGGGGADGVRGTQGSSLQISQSTLQSGQRFPSGENQHRSARAQLTGCVIPPARSPGWGLEPPGSVAGAGTRGAWKSLPTQSVLGFCDSKIPCRSSLAWSTAGMGSVSPVSL